jgi:8-oxo-dGTP pyrophosphatase MutT (NUDIX family)
MDAGVERIAMALLVRHDQVLMVHRHPERQFYPDCWDLPGGHIEAAESPAQAARRECLEEIGVTVGGLRAIPMACSDPLLETHAFLVESWEGEPANTAPAEHDVIRWFDIDDLARLDLADEATRADIIAAATQAGGPLGV